MMKEQIIEILEDIQPEADYETFKRAFLEKEQGIAAFR